MRFNKSFNITIIIFFALAFLFYMNIFKGPAEGYWDTYITVPGVLMTNHHIDFLDINGENMYDYTLSGNVLKNLKAPESYGIAPKDQRLGAGILVSLPFLFLGSFGLKFIYALINLLIGVITFFTVKKLFDNSIYAFIASVLLLSNPYFLSIDRLNPNSAGLLITVTIVYFMTFKNKYWFLIGILYGVLGSIRPETILMFPAFLAFVSFKRGSRKNIFLLFSGAFISFLPTLIWNRYAFGVYLIHSSQYSGFRGFRPVFEHSLLGLKFMFNGLLNWPFYEKIIRTPHFPFPTFLIIPFVLIRSFGVILISAAVVGFFSFFKIHKRLCIFFAVYTVLFMMMLIVQENWEELKLTYILLIFNILIIYIIAGIHVWLSSRKKTFVNSLFVGIMLLTALFVTQAGSLEFVADKRWYQRFPKAAKNESGYDSLPEYERKGYAYFQTRETEKEIEYQKNKLTRLSLLPQKYNPETSKQYNKTSIFSGFMQRDVKILEIWDWIYAETENDEKNNTD